MTNGIHLCRYVPPSEQLKRLRELPHAFEFTSAWPFTERDFDRAERTMPPDSDYGLPETAIVQLVPYLPYGDSRMVDKQKTDGWRRTFRELWFIASRVFPEYHCEVLLDDDGSFDNLTFQAERRYKPGLFWEKIDLSANLLANPSEVVAANPSLPGVGILAYIAMQPEMFRKHRYSIVLGAYGAKTVMDFDFLGGRERKRAKGSSVLISYDPDDPGLNLFTQGKEMDPDRIIRQNSEFTWNIPVFL